MRIAVNTRFLLNHKMEGFGWYAYETLRRITVQHPEHQFIFLFDRKFDRRFIFGPNVEGHIIYPPARHPVLFNIWYNRSVARALRKTKADLFFSPDGHVCLRTNVPTVAVVHDLNFEHYPNDHRPNMLRYFKKNFPLFCNRADRIITISRFSKQDIIQQYGCDTGKINVVYNGVREEFHPISETEKIALRKKFTTGNNFLLFIGALNPRKNIARLFQAYDQFRTNGGENLPLLIVGEKYNWNKEIELAYSSMKYKSSVIFTGHVSSDELVQITGAAHALLFVSYFEGFGLPVVEAMKAGVPVLTSTTSALPEIAGGAALLCNPFSVDAIAEGIKCIVSDDSMRKELIEKGVKRAAEFDWQKTAGEIWQTILEVAHAEKLL